MYSNESILEGLQKNSYDFCPCSAVSPLGVMSIRLPSALFPVCERGFNLSGEVVLLCVHG